MSVDEFSGDHEGVGRNMFVVPPLGGVWRSCRLKAELRTNSCPTFKWAS